MKNSKRTFEGAGQSTTEVKPQKHDANLQKNSTLYFQIGLILCLLGTYALFEMQFQEKMIIPDEVEVREVALIDVPPIFTVEPDTPKKVESKVDRSSYLMDKVKEVPDETKVVEKEIFTPDAPDTTPEPVDVSDIETFEPPVEVFVPFSRIEKVPVYPGCERKKTNDEKRKCMSKKITKLINKKFNAGIANDYGISGLLKIHTQFTVDKEGNITDIRVRGPHPALEKEAKRVINKIPHMKPGYQRDTPVGVIYTLPIKFDAGN